MKWRERVDAFPSQLSLFFVWLVPGGVASWLLRHSVPWVQFLSWYAILVTHFCGHLAWRAKRAADRQEQP